MLFGAHLVEDPDPEATQFGLKRDVPHSPAPTPFAQFLRSSRFAAAPAPAPAGQLFPVVQMPRVTDTSNLEFSLDKTLEGIYARERQEQLQLKTLQTKLKLTDEQAAEMDLLGAVRKELARQRAENGEPEELPNPIVEKLQKTLRELPPLPSKKKKKRPPLPKRRRKPPQLTEVEMLRREMAKSRAKAQVLEKEMCLSASKAMGVTGPRVFQSGRFSHAEAYVQAAGFDTLVKTVTRLLNAQLGAGWTKWWDFVKFDRWEEAQRKVMMKHAAAEVWNGVQETFNRLIGMRWDRWTTVVHQQRLEENRVVSDRNATTVGRYVRGHMARLYVVKLVAARLALRRYNAACVIQTEERRLQATERVERLRVKRTRYVAATMIQALARGLFGKRRFAYEKELARHVASAVLVQNSWRRNKSLRLVRRVLRFNRREKAACCIQCRQRQRRAKRRYDALKLAKDQRDASTKIQSLARAVFARVLADELYEAREKYENDRYDAATYLQGAWRAREARVLFGSKLRKLMERRRLEARSQACIAKWHRGWMGRLLCGNLHLLDGVGASHSLDAVEPTSRTRFADEKKKRLKSMCAEAKKVEELWDDQGAAFYYYDTVRNQSFHEPPKTGYKRRDELLVLATGEAVEDPDHVLNDQQQAANAAADAAKLLFGLYSEKASKPMEELQGFLQERLALGGAASDVRMVQDERFNETCSTLETLSNELYYAGRLGRPGAKPPVRVEQEALQQELEKRVQEALLQQQSSIYSSTGLAEGSTTTGTLHRKSQISMMGWQELYDDQGNKYWYDEATGASQYENPYEGMERPSQMTQQSPPSKFERPQTSYSERAAGLSRPETRGTEASHNSIIPSEEWQQAQDHEGNFYWYNTRTNQSQYEDPYDGSRPDTAGYQLGSPTGATYDTNQGTYDNTYDGSNYDQSAPVYALEGAAQSPWSKHQDEQGYDYWYNAETHDSTYDDPHALQG